RCAARAFPRRLQGNARRDAADPDSPRTLRPETCDRAACTPSIARGGLTRHLAARGARDLCRSNEHTFRAARARGAQLAYLKGLSLSGPVAFFLLLSRCLACLAPAETAGLRSGIAGA